MSQPGRVGRTSDVPDLEGDVPATDLAEVEGNGGDDFLAPLEED